jgi:hypothetical protein
LTILLRTVEHEQLADVLDRRRVEFVADLFVDGDARFAVVAEHADLDQAVRIEAGEISFMTDSVRPASPIMTTGLSPWASARRAERARPV